MKKSKQTAKKVNKQLEKIKQTAKKSKQAAGKKVNSNKQTAD